MVSKVKQEEALRQAKEDFEGAALSAQYRTFIKWALEAFSFYEGRQWSEEEQEALEDRGQIPAVVNKIQPRIDNIAGQEIRTRTKVKYRARSNNDQEQLTADALSNMAYYVQEKEESTYLLSDVAQNARICGLGWLGLDVQNNEIKMESHSPLEVVYDVSDRSKDLTDQRFNCVIKWMYKDDAIARFPDKKDEIDAIAPDARRTTVTESEINDDALVDKFFHDLDGSYIDTYNSRILIVEHQRRETATFYEVMRPDGSIVETYDRQEAEKLAKDKKSIFEKEGYKIFFTYYTGELLLDHFEYEYQLDKFNGVLTTTPFVHKREKMTGIPVGMVKAAIDPQRLYNKTNSKLKWLMAAQQVIGDADAVEDIEEMKRQIARPDGVVWRKAGKALEFNKHMPEIQAHYQSLQLHDKEIQDALGVFDENLGMQTNATSGVAIQSRQQSGIITQMLPLDRFRAMKRRVGIKLLKLIRSVYTEEQAFYVVDDENIVQAIELNKPVRGEDGEPEVDEKGNAILQMDVRVGRYNTYVDEVPDVSSQLEEANQKLLELSKTIPMPNWTPGLLQWADVPRSHELYKEIEQGVQQKLQFAEEAQKSMAQAQQKVSPEAGAATGGSVQPLKVA